MTLLSTDHPATASPTTTTPVINNRLWSQHIRHLTPYVPGEQPKLANLCKLNTNENPFPPSPHVAAAIAEAIANQADTLKRYPSFESEDLRQALADLHGLDINQVFVGNGSDEVLAHIFTCFFVKDRPVLTPEIGYSFYPVYADTFQIELVKIPLKSDFSIDVDDYRRPCGGIILANPNAPTGILLARGDIERLLKEHTNAVVVIDEAYIDFADAANVSAVELVNQYDNLIVVQTFSKSRSLAGLRVGMAFANPSLIEALTRYKNSFNSYPLDTLAQVGALASVQDVAYFSACCRQVMALRQDLSMNLTMQGFHVLPSQANFVFAKPPESLMNGDTAQVFAALREQGIVVRYFNQPKIRDYLRITVGTAEQNQRLLNALISLATP